ncbi:Periplasmic nitrate reductase [Streptomyces sp. enrichment culture]
MGRYGSGLQPLRGQNNVQGGGDMGAIPNLLPGFQDILDPAWDTVIQPHDGLNLTEMFEAMEEGTLRPSTASASPRAVGGGQRAGRTTTPGPGFPGHAGHLPHQDGRAGARGPARHGRLGGDRRHDDATLGDLLRLAEVWDGLRAVLLGGAAGGFLRAEELDIPLTFEGTREAGTTLVSGVVMAFDDTVPLPRLLLRIAVEHDAPLTDSACAYCGNCIEVCPTGALSFKSEFDMRAAGTRDESAQTTTTTVCAYCGVGCNLTLHVRDNEIVKVTSPHDNPVTHGNLCIKGRFGYQHVQNRG